MTPVDRALHSFFIWLLIDPDDGVARFVPDADRDEIHAIARLHRQALDGEAVPEEAWSSAAAAAMAPFNAANAAACAGWCAFAGKSVAPQWAAWAAMCAARAHAWGQVDNPDHFGVISAGTVARVKQSKMIDKLCKVYALEGADRDVLRSLLIDP